MKKSYNPVIDNLMMSIPAKPLERWRVEMQGLYEGMKRSIADPIVIDGQYYDVHDELSDFANSDFGVTQAEVVVGMRKLVFSDFIPVFLNSHQKFFDLVQRLSPETNPKERHASAHETAEIYKGLIDSINKSKEEIDFIDHSHIFASIPNEFNLHNLVKNNLSRHIDCFNYPRCKFFTTNDYAAALGNYHILKSVIETVKPNEFAFIPSDDPYYEDLYPGSLGSYKARIQFTGETLEKLDLAKLRDKRIIDIIKSN